MRMWDEPWLGADEPPSEIPEKKARRRAEPWIEDLVGAIADPIIVLDEGWGQSLPQWIKEDIRLERLIQLMKGARKDKPLDEASDLEAFAYLYTASLSFPLNGEWLDIYMWLGAEVTKGKPMAKALEEQIGGFVPVKLYHQHYVEFAKLKRWIHQKKLEARKERR